MCPMIVKMADLIVIFACYLPFMVLGIQLMYVGLTEMSEQLEDSIHWKYKVARFE